MVRCIYTTYTRVDDVVKDHVVDLYFSVQRKKKKTIKFDRLLHYVKHIRARTQVNNNACMVFSCAPRRAGLIYEMWAAEVTFVEMT